MTSQGPLDPGLQPERTELAWRRTALAIAVGSLVSLRIFPLMLPENAANWGLLPGAIGLVAACALWFGSRRRQAQLTAWLGSTMSEPHASIDGDRQATSPTVRPPGAGMLLALTLLATVFGALAIAIVAVVFFVGVAS
ncbi:DUF202 domain-containing protein [Microbacterium sp. NPDC076768]|uniref:DUF202 domain-containing protein n=1 Tax=Microbacterium sp. NPDC076768 TaxID=3154858 RepID=UPI00341FB90D